MASYYYLISSLPDLKTDGEMPFTYDEFLGMCQSNVSESKHECLRKLTLSSEEGPLMKEWAAFYKNLMSELNYQKSGKTLSDILRQGFCHRTGGGSSACCKESAGSREDSFGF